MSCFLSFCPSPDAPRVAAFVPRYRGALARYGCVAWKPSKHDGRMAASEDELAQAMGGDLLACAPPMDAFSRVAAEVDGRGLCWSPTPLTPPPKPPPPLDDEVVLVKTVPAPAVEEVVYVKTVAAPGARRALRL